ncbi:hypothetical protein RND71_005513 [Anisodus tanguticus]|uniref:glucan endo-1,3-beta-D-glucosidase n=1 Tax=Anisodus tanguticus TaxID=243964 RepID=A0AAE1SSA3_9SOLA|nr:hypothetical protein RND71_005513 [Anisodus tanguticus]
MENKPNKKLLLLLLFLVALSFPVVTSIGVNYGTLGNNLPPPAQVAQFLKDKTVIDHIKIFDINPDILRAFANTGISVTVTVPNGEIPNLIDFAYAKRYIEANIKPFYPQTKIQVILIGNEVLHWDTPEVQNKLVPAMKIFYQALGESGLKGIKVSSPHSLGILLRSNPPSAARFRPGWDVGILAPMLQFLRETKGPFMVNPYPYFGYNPKQEDFLLFRKNKGVYDRFSKRWYTNSFDMLLDAVYMSMVRLKYPDVEIVAAETGWPSAGESYEPQCTVENAASYNGGLLRKYNSGTGTPLMPKRKIETYIFGLFNENTKPGSIAERNFGLFRPDFTPVYNIGVLKGEQAHPTPSSPAPKAGGGTKDKPKSKSPVEPAQNKQFCMPKVEATDAQLQSNINYVCSQGVDCTSIQVGGSCFTPNTIRSHAAFAMNSYYQKMGRNNFNCDFAGTGVVASADPSYGTCKYDS